MKRILLVLLFATLAGFCQNQWSVELRTKYVTPTGSLIYDEPVVRATLLGLPQVIFTIGSPQWYELGISLEKTQSFGKWKKVSFSYACYKAFSEGKGETPIHFLNVKGEMKGYLLHLQRSERKGSGVWSYRIALPLGTALLTIGGREKDFLGYWRLSLSLSHERVVTLHFQKGLKNYSSGIWLEARLK